MNQGALARVDQGAGDQTPKPELWDELSDAGVANHARPGMAPLCCRSGTDTLSRNHFGGKPNPGSASREPYSLKSGTRKLETRSPKSEPPNPEPENRNLKPETLARSTRNQAQFMLDGLELWFGGEGFSCTPPLRRCTMGSLCTWTWRVV